MRGDREDVTAQRAAVAAARDALASALALLDSEARTAGKAAARPKGNPDLEAVTRAHNAVQRAGEALDIAVYDLHTASGEDG